MQPRPLLVLAALAAATSPDLGRSSLEQVKDGIRDRFAKDPQGTVISTVLAASYLFYRAEHGKNPKVKSFYDALVYVSTNLSVGYCDIFATTPAGKLLGSALMTYGPAMATRLLDAPTAGRAPATSEVTERLDKILAALEALRADGPLTVRDPARPSA
jgi:hypothetical protein